LEPKASGQSQRRRCGGWFLEGENASDARARGPPAAPPAALERTAAPARSGTLYTSVGESEVAARRDVWTSRASTPRHRVIDRLSDLRQVLVIPRDPERLAAAACNAPSGADRIRTGPAPSAGAVSRLGSRSTPARPRARTARSAPVPAARRARRRWHRGGRAPVQREHVTVEEHDGVEGLVLARRAEPAVEHEVVEERLARVPPARRPVDPPS